MFLSAGTRLGPYEILSALGAGGMGEVYRARDTRLARIVAIKLLTGPVDQGARGRLLDEARAAAALNHPNICTIHEIADADDRPFIVMEHIDGPLLSEVAAGGAPIDAAIRYGTQITDALAHAHDRGVVHRDLKTANLMLTSDGRVKVLDFGIAHRFTDPAIDSATQMPTLAPGLAAGTLAYIAPEVLRGGIADRRADIWAIGVVLYELLAGRRPFGGETTFELSSAILRDALPPLPTTVPKTLRALVARCLEKDPSQRYQRAAEVRAALEMIAAGTAPEKSARQSRATTRAPRARKAEPVGASRIRAIAVLPLDNLSRDPEQEYFADGITEALIGAVARIDGLRVISRTSIMRFKGTQKGVPEIARELNVDGIIAGSVRRVADRVRISTQLVDAAQDAQIWSATYDRDLGDILALETEIATAVAGEIALEVRRTSNSGRSADRKVSPETYAVYLKARHLQRQFGEANLRKAVDCYEQAIARDPQYAPAHAGLADVYHWLAFFEWVEPQEAYGISGRAAARALELDPDLADAHMALGSVKFNFEWDWTAAERAFRRAIEINPNAAEVRVDYALFLGNVGRLDEAIAQDEAARDVDPLWFAPHQGLAYWSFLLGRYDDSLAHHQVALQLEPNAPHTLLTNGMLQLELSRVDEALELFRRAQSTSGGTSFFTACLAVACARSGRRSEAEQLVATIEERGKSRYISCASLCWALLALGRQDDALSSLRAAYERHDSMLCSLASFSWWDPIRDTDVFRDVFTRMNFSVPGRQARFVAPAAPPTPART